MAKDLASRDTPEQPAMARLARRWPREQLQHPQAEDGSGWGRGATAGCELCPGRQL